MKKAMRDTDKTERKADNPAEVRSVKPKVNDEADAHQYRLWQAEQLIREYNLERQRENE